MTAKGKELTADEETIIADYNSRWVAVNGVGSVLLTSQDDNEIAKLTAPQIRAGDKTPATLYSGVNTPSVFFFTLGMTIHKTIAM